MKSNDLIHSYLSKPVIKHLIVALLLILITVLYCSPILQNLDALGRGDWDYVYFVHDVAQMTMLSHKQFPFWNPYYVGGASLLGNAQSRFFSLSPLHTLWPGVVVGVKLEFLSHLFLGMLGMYFLSRHFKISGVSTLLPGIIFGLNGIYALRFAEGHIPIVLPAMYLPYVLLFFLKGRQKTKYIFLSAIFMTLMLYEGGITLIPFTCLFIGLISAFLSIQDRCLKPLLSCGVLVILFVLFSAPKLFPVIELMRNYPRSTPVGPSVPLNYLFAIYLDPLQSVYRLYRPIPALGWWELGAYIGVFPFILFLGSFSLLKKHWPLLTTGLIFFLISLGNFGSFSPWAVLHRLPVFSSMWIPSRVNLFFVFALSILSGLFFYAFSEKLFLNQFRRNLFRLLVLGFLLFDLCRVNSRVLYEAFVPQKLSENFVVKYSHPVIKDQPAFKQKSVPKPLQFQYGAWSAMHSFMLRNIGTVNGYEPIPIKNNAVAKNSENYKGEFYLIGNGGEVQLSHWSPNKMVFDYKLNQPDTLVINQNFDGNWKSSSHVVKPFHGKLSVSLDPSRTKTTVYYFPFSFVLGLCGAGVGGLCFIYRNRIFYFLK